MKIEFDPFDYKETSAVLQIAKNNCPSAFQTMTSTNGMSSQKGGIGYQDLMKDYLKFKEKSETLGLQLDELKKDNEKKDETIQKDKQEIMTLNKEIENITKKNEEEKGFYEMERDEFKQKELKLNEELSAKDDAFRKLQRELGNENLHLKNKVDSLKKQLEMYEPTLGGEMGEISYYRVEDDRLVQTMSSDAYYMAKVGKDNRYIYQFNYEKGPLKEACMNKEHILFPFCEIIEEVSEANTISLGPWGVAEPTSSGDLNVITKAKIRLTRI